MRSTRGCSRSRKSDGSANAASSNLSRASMLFLTASRNKVFPGAEVGVKSTFRDSGGVGQHRYGGSAQSRGSEMTAAVRSIRRRPSEPWSLSSCRVKPAVFSFFPFKLPCKRTRVETSVHATSPACTDVPLSIRPVRAIASNRLRIPLPGVPASEQGSRRFIDSGDEAQVDDKYPVSNSRGGAAPVRSSLAASPAFRSPASSKRNAAGPPCM